MGVVIRQGAKASLISYVGAFLGYLNWLYFFPKWISSEEIGLFKALFDAALLFTPFLQAGASNLVVKFAPYFYDDERKEGKFLSYILGVPLLLSAFFVLAFYFFQGSIVRLYIEKSPVFVEYLWYVVPLAIISVFIIIVESLVRVQMRIVVPRLIREVLIRVLNIFIVFLYFLDFIDLKEVIIGFILINILHIIFILTYYAHLRGKLIFPLSGITRTRYIRPLADYSFFMILGSGGGMLVSKLDTLMTTYLLGLSQTGIYGIAFLIAQVIELPRRTFTAILSPLLAKAYKGKDFPLLQDYYHKSALNMSIIGIMLFIGIWSNINLVYHFVPNKELYITGKWVVFFIGLSKVLDMSMGVNNEIIVNSRYYRWNIYMTPALAILAIFTNLLFIPLYGITGAAFATFISVVLYNTLRVLLVRKKMGITPFNRKNFVVALLGILCFFITEWIEVTDVWLDLLVNILLLGVIFIIPLLILKVSDEFQRLYVSIRKRIL